MPRACTICTHDERAAIEAAIVAGSPATRIAANSRVSSDAVLRHAANHLPAVVAQGAATLASERAVTVAQQVQTRDAETVMYALDVVAQLKAINNATLRVLHDAHGGDKTEADGKKPNPDLVLKAVDRVQRQIELQAKLIGQLDERPQVNILIAPEWLALRAVLLAALAPYPEARMAVAARLHALESSQ